MRKIILSSWVALVPAVVACSGGMGLEDDADGAARLSAESSDLSALTEYLWPQKIIPVCFKNSPLTTEKQWIVETMRGGRSWEHAGNIAFTGWADCPADTASLPPTIIVEVRNDGSTPSGTNALGHIDRHAHVRIDARPSVAQDYSRCIVNGLPREDCIRAMTLHEFGHALGFMHEHNRIDTDPSCTDAPQGPTGDWDFGPWDANSVTNYCEFAYELSSQDRAGMEYFYGRSRAGDGRLRDFNGDGRADLLCSDRKAGTLSIDLANLGGSYNGADWTSANGMCLDDLITGYFDQNAHADLICQGLLANVIGVSYGNSQGSLVVGSGIPSSFCKGSDSQVSYVGDFNGDSRHDRLCHDYVTGEFWIDYADLNGRFTDGADYYRNGHWCTHPRQLFVGKFNTDSRSDVLCHDVLTGQKWIDYADANGRFGGSDWTRNGHWCGNPHRQIHIGDFDNNGREDILCHDTSNGDVWIDYVDGSGRFMGTDWSRPLGLCTEGRLFTGNINGTGGDDLLCQITKTNTLAIYFGDSAGRFLGADLALSTGFCNPNIGRLQ